MLFKNSVRTSKRTPHYTITKINWLTLFKFNPLKPKLVYIIFKNSVRTSKRTPHYTITKINWLMLFKEIIAVYPENHMKHKYKM
jgi:transcriptional antiterminator